MIASITVHDNEEGDLFLSALTGLHHVGYDFMLSYDLACPALNLSQFNPMTSKFDLGVLAAYEKKASVGVVFT